MRGAPLQSGRCLNCDYNLHGLGSDRCPECGRLFDIRDARTMRPATAPTLWALPRCLLAPVGPPMALLSVAGVMVVFWCARFPWDIRRSMLLYQAIWPALVALWGTRLLLHVRAVKRYGMPRERHAAWLGKWAVLPTLGLIAAVLVHYERPQAVAMWVSRSAMDRQAYAPGAGNRQPGWLGLYRVDGIDTHGQFPILESEEGDCCWIPVDANFAQEPASHPNPDGWKWQRHHWHWLFTSM